MSLKQTVPTNGGDYVQFGNATTPVAAQVGGYEDSTGNGHLELYTTAGGTVTEQVRVTSAGNVGIGVASPSAKLHVRAASTGSTAYGIMLDAGAQQHSWYLTDNFTSTFSIGSSSGQFTWATSAGERMRIDSSGNVSVNGASTAGQLTSSANALSQNPLALIDTGTTYNTGIYFIRFVNSAGNTAGAVQHTAVATVAYATTSDRRLKENIVDAPDSLDKIMAVKIRSYDWKDDVTHVDYGVIAQELYDVIPEVVGKGSDTETIDDDKGTWQVEYGRLTPILIKAIQEQQAIITELKSRIEALEAK